MTWKDRSPSTLQECVALAVAAVEELPSGSKVDHVDFGQRRDPPGWWWSVVAVQYHRLGSSPSAQPDADRRRENVLAVITRSIDVARQSPPTEEDNSG